MQTNKQTNKQQQQQQQSTYANNNNNNNNDNNNNNNLRTPGAGRVFSWPLSILPANTNSITH